jgi:hypothetical protein
MKKPSLLLFVFGLAAAGSARAQIGPEFVAAGTPIAMNILSESRTPGPGGNQTIVLPSTDAPAARVSGSVTSSAFEERRPTALIPLYISLAALQWSDAASTRSGLEAGAREANPLVAPFAGSTAGLLALKAGVGATMIYATERLWKQNRKAAVLVLVITNAGYAAVVSHNLAMARR